MMRSGYQGSDFYQKMWQDLEDTGSWTGIVWNRNKSGIVYPIYLTISRIINKADAKTYYLGIFSDISQLQMEKKHQLNLQKTDFLTGLPNKTDFAAHFNEVIKENLQGQAGRFAVIVININEFQIINDQYGFVFGDSLLREIAQRARKLDFNAEMLARIGADKFALLIPMLTDTAELDSYIQLIQSVFNKSYMIDDIEVYVTCRTAAAVIPDSKLSFEEIIAQSDRMN